MSISTIVLNNKKITIFNKTHLVLFSTARTLKKKDECLLIIFV